MKTFRLKATIDIDIEIEAKSEKAAEKIAEKASLDLEFKNFPEDAQCWSSLEDYWEWEIEEVEEEC